MWVLYARTVLAQALTHPGTPGETLPPEAVERFEHYLDAWEDVAALDTEFVWIDDVDPEEIEFLAHTWFGLARDLAEEAEQRGYPLAPPEGDEFYQALLTALLDALTAEGRSMREFSEMLRAQWPGLKDD